MAARTLNKQQAEFARLIAGGMLATDAYILAYPGDYPRHVASVNASRLLKHKLVKAARDAAREQQAATVAAAIDGAVARYGVTAERVADAMARLAFTDLRDIVSWRTVQENGKKRVEVDVRDASAITGDAHQAIAELRRSAGGEITVKLFNKREALMDIARLKGWIADKPVDQRNLVMLKIER